MLSLFRQVLIYIDCNPTAGTSNIETEKNVRRSIDAAPTTDLEYGAGVHDHREPQEHRKLWYLFLGLQLIWQMATVDAMRVANKEMKKQYKGIDIDKIEVSPHMPSLLR
jgi:predicted branched-subunit amino acid permease